VLAGGAQIGVIGELHPLVHANYQLPGTPLLAATINMQALMAATPERYEATPVSLYPPVLEDLALIVDEALPAGQVAALIAQTGGEAVTDVRLFDVYRGDQLGSGKKSLAYSITYQAEDRTLTDEEVAKLREKIVKRLEKEVGAQLRDS
jgi:phenylalanyl-tRNA synthetase beta chain